MCPGMHLQVCVLCVVVKKTYVIALLKYDTVASILWCLYTDMQYSCRNIIKTSVLPWRFDSCKPCTAFQNKAHLPLICTFTCFPSFIAIKCLKILQQKSTKNPKNMWGIEICKFHSLQSPLTLLDSLWFLAWRSVLTPLFEGLSLSLIWLVVSSHGSWFCWSCRGLELGASPELVFG